MSWELSFNDADLWELCERFAQSQDFEGKTHVYKAINAAARSHGRFDFQLKNGEYLDGLTLRVFNLVKMTNTCSIGGHEVWIDKDGFYTMRWEDYDL